VRGTSTTRRSCTRGATSRSAPWRTPTGAEPGRGRGCRRVPQLLLLLPSPDLQPLYRTLLDEGARASAIPSARRTGSSPSIRDCCRGYRYPVEGCPYKKAFYNAQTKTSEKCISVTPGSKEKGRRARCGPRPAPRTAAAVWHRRLPDDEDGPIHKLVNEYEVALRLHPEYRTEPNVYYIPPYAPPQTPRSGETVDANRIPRNYLEELFGPEVESALHHDQPRAGEGRARRGERTHGDPSSTVNNDDQYRLEVFDDDG